MASVHKTKTPSGGLSWRVRWRDGSGKMRSKSFPKKRDADKHAASVETDKHRGQELNADLAKATLGSYAKAYAERRANWRAGTRGTHDAHMVHINAHLGSKTLASITAGDIETMRAKLLGSGLSPAYAEAVVYRVRSILKSAVADRAIGRNPAEQVRANPARKSARAVALTPDQFQAVIGALKEPWVRYAQLIAYTGLRPSEAAGLTWDRITDEGIVVDRQLVGMKDRKPIFGPLKTDSSVRTIPTPSALKEWEPGGDGELVFVGRQGGGLVRSTRQSAWVAMRNQVMLPDACRGWHTLRHTYVSHALAAGVPLTNVSKQIGHKTISETMQTYAHMIEGSDTQYADVVADLLK